MPHDRTGETPYTQHRHFGAVIALHTGTENNMVNIPRRPGESLMDGSKISPGLFFTESTCNAPLIA